MMKAADLPETIPLFPLPGALLLPRARLPLHIFEPRYLAMIEDCMKTPHRLIGMIQPRELPGAEASRDFGASRLHAIGCAGRLTGFSETEDRRYLVSLTGVSRFRIRAEVEGFTPYRRAQVDWAGFGRDLGNAEDDAGLDRDGFLDLLGRYFARQKLDAEWGELAGAESELLLNSLSMLCPFSPEDKQALLEAPSLTTRRETLVTLMEFALLGGGMGDEVLQ